jgi:glucose/mannose-6-phosphate isomerase
MLDDLNVIKQRDPHGALEIAALEPAQLQHNFDTVGKILLERPVKNVVVAGMGGSAWPAEFISTWPAVSVPLTICRNYSLPSFVDEDSLVIISSYSGNTEETLAAYEDARAKSARVVVQSHGGKLTELAVARKDVLSVIPDSSQPRMATLYFYRSIVEILIGAGVASADALDEMSALTEPLNNVVKDWLPTEPVKSNLAKQIALQMAGKTAVIYSGPQMYPAAIKWKIACNENAKNTAWCNFYPEFSHNEFIGWSGHPIEKPFAVINLMSNFENPRIGKRFEITERLLSGKKPVALNVDAKGTTPLEQLLYLTVLGEFVTIYLAILNGVDPTPVDLVEKFKKELQ